MLRFHKFIFFKVRKLPKKLPKKPVSSKKRQSKVKNLQRNWLQQPPHSQTSWRRLKLVWRLKLTLQPMMKYLLWVLWKKPIKPRPRRKMPLKKWPRQSKSLKRSQQFCQRFKSLVSLYIQPGRLNLRIICCCQPIFCALLPSVLLPTHLHYRHVSSGGAGGAPGSTACPPPKFLDFATCLILLNNPRTNS